MFIRLTRCKTSKNPTVQVVESYREGPKVRQRIIASLGVVRNAEDRQRLINMGHALIAKLSSEQDPQMPLLESTALQDEKSSSDEKKLNPKDLIHIRNQPCGFEDIFSALSKEIGFSDLYSEIDSQHKFNFSCRNVVQMLVQKRIEEPSSKRRSLYLDTQEKGALECELHQVYRAMDAIEPFTDKFQTLAHLAAQNLLEKVECYFYDATTLYFESVLQDEIRDFGYSKDGKFNQVQVLLCLLVTERGLPVGYEIFAGNTGETKTLQTALENLSKKFNVVKATIVCDRGMLSKDNLDFAQSSTNMNYIIGEKLRKLPAKQQDLIFDKSTYVKSGETLIKDVDHPTRVGARLILIYSESRAKKDKQDRERLLKKIQKKLKKKENEPKVFISNSGVKKYVLAQGGTVRLNLEAIAKDEKWDGFFGIVTDHKDLTAEKIISQYRGLWQVEAAFRLTKHNLSTRPIFHWTPHRIKTHISICFQALVLERHLEVRLEKSGLFLTTKNIHDALSMCQKIILQDKRTHRLFEMDSNKPPEAKQIYQAVGLPWRKQTRELPKPEGLVVSSVGCVKPQDIGIAPL